MTGRDISPSLREAAYAQETDKVLIALLTINHPSFSQPIRVTDEPLEDFGNEIYGVTSRGEQYIFVPFDVDFPDEDEQLVQFLEVRLDSTDRSIIDAIRTAASSNVFPTAMAEVVLHDNPDVPDMVVTGLRLKMAQYNNGILTGRFSTEHTDSQVFPANFFRPSLFPGIFDGVG